MFIISIFDEKVKLHSFCIRFSILFTFEIKLARLFCAFCQYYLCFLPIFTVLFYYTNYVTMYQAPAMPVSLRLCEMEIFSMKYIKTILCLFVCACLLSGCQIQKDRYVASALNTVCHGDSAEYSKLTGKTSSELTTEQKNFLEIQTDRILAWLGGEGCSDEMRKRYINFVKMIYESASYEVASSDKSEDELTVSFRPCAILTAHTEEIKACADKFSAANEEFQYSSLSSEEYADKYLDSVLGLLGTYLSSPEYGEPQQVTVQIEKNDDGMYTIKPGTLSRILEGMLPVPG